MKKYLVGTIISVLGGSASMAVDLWPELPRSGFIVGRAAEEADVKRGDAVFFTKSGGTPNAKPAGLQVPQFAYLTDERGIRLPVVVVQAESNERGIFLGMRDAAGKEYVATKAEVTLLGKAHPR